MTTAFPLVDEYHGLRLGLDLAAVEPGQVVVVETPQRLAKEQSYGYVRALWWLWLEDGRSALSVPPGTGLALGPYLDAGEADGPGELAAGLVVPINAALEAAGLAAVDRVWADMCLACNGELLRTHNHGDCRRLVDDSVPPADGLGLPEQCFPNGIVYGVVADGRVASVAFAHRSGIMEDRLADVGIETAPAYRRRGFAQTALSTLVAHMTETGGEARYGCSPDNAASVATARSVGFVPYARSLVLAAPRCGTREADASE